MKKGLALIFFVFLKLPLLANSEIVDLNATTDIKIVRSDETFRVEILANIKDGWSLYSLYPYPDQPLLVNTKIDDTALAKFVAITPWYESKLAIKEFPLLNLVLPVHQRQAKFYRNYRVPADINFAQTQFQLNFSYQICSQSICLPPHIQKIPLRIDWEEGVTRSNRLAINKAIDDTPQGLVSFKDNTNAKTNWIEFIFLAISAGLLGLLTPCVLPMIPIVANHFLIQKNTVSAKPALLRHKILSFFLGITSIYSLTGLAASLLFGASAVLNIAANPVVNLLSGGLFLFFGLSLIGVIKINLNFLHFQSLERYVPQNQLLNAALIGVTFTLSAFTCNMQLIGGLLVLAAGGAWFKPLLGMLIYSITFGVPFLVFAIFPKIFESFKLKFGFWQKQLQITIAVLEIMVAAKFFANFDLSLGIGFISRDFVLIFYILLLIFAVGYSLYSFKQFFDGTFVKKALAVPIFFGALCVFGVYFFYQGLDNKSLGKVVDAYLPPPKSGQYLLVSSESYVSEDIAKSLIWYSNVEDALSQAKLLNKLIFIDFTGYTCLNCRWMEQNIFRNKQVFQALQKDFVLLRLYTDAGEGHIQNQQYQIENFKTVALPFYAIVKPYSKILTSNAGIIQDPADFLEFLKLKTI